MSTNDEYDAFDYELPPYRPLHPRREAFTMALALAMCIGLVCWIGWLVL